MKFQDLWATVLESKARQLGITSPVDVGAARQAVRSLCASVGWLEGDDLSFVTVADKTTCLNSATAVLEKRGQAAVMASLAPKEGEFPTQARLVADTKAKQVPFVAAENVVTAAVPGLACADERCPRCSSTMLPVELVNGKTGMYCTQDRVVVPM